MEGVLMTWGVLGPAPAWYPPCPVPAAGSIAVGWRGGSGLAGSCWACATGCTGTGWPAWCASGGTWVCKLASGLGSGCWPDPIPVEGPGRACMRFGLLGDIPRIGVLGGLVNDGLMAGPPGFLASLSFNSSKEAKFNSLGFL